MFRAAYLFVYGLGFEDLGFKDLGFCAEKTKRVVFWGSKEGFVT